MSRPAVTGRTARLAPAAAALVAVAIGGAVVATRRAVSLAAATWNTPTCTTADGSAVAETPTAVGAPR